jgi:hypothetical protein
MKYCLMSAIVLVVLCSTALAQDNAPKAEIFGGYSYMRTAGSSNVNGLNVASTFYVKKWFGITGDLAGHYQRQPASSNTYTFLAGPQLAGRAAKITGFAHVLFGGAHVGDQFQLIGGGVQGGHNCFVVAFGGGVDLNVSEKVSVRAFQADYENIRVKNPLTFQNEGTNNFRLSFGIVFKVK